MLSNHNTPFIREIYKGFDFKIVKARRNVNSKGNGRGEVEEVVVRNY
jgi:DNA adenine methylase